MGIVNTAFEWEIGTGGGGTCMAKRDGTKRPAFDMWKDGKSAKEIEKGLKKEDPKRTTKRESIEGWIKDWERGKQGSWDPDP